MGWYWNQWSPGLNSLTYPDQDMAKTGKKHLSVDLFKQLEGKHMETPIFSCKHRGFNQETWKRNHILVGGTNGLAYPVAIYNSIFGHKTALPTGLGVQITSPWLGLDCCSRLEIEAMMVPDYAMIGAGLWDGRALLSRDETAPMSLEYFGVFGLHRDVTSR